jgi:hypothetical protein
MLFTIIVLCDSEFCDVFGAEMPTVITHLCVNSDGRPFFLSVRGFEGRTYTGATANRDLNACLGHQHLSSMNRASSIP